jgi:hypothetical protein
MDLNTLFVKNEGRIFSGYPFPEAKSFWDQYVINMYMMASSIVHSLLKYFKIVNSATVPFLYRGFCIEILRQGKHLCVVSDYKCDLMDD